MNESGSDGWEALFEEIDRGRWRPPLKFSWREKERYPSKADEFNDAQWRWEFLRRSDSYLAAWESADQITNAEEVMEYRPGGHWRSGIPSADGADPWRIPKPSDDHFRLPLLLNPNCDDGWFDFAGKSCQSIFTQASYRHLKERGERFNIKGANWNSYVFSYIAQQLNLPRLSEDWSRALAAFDLELPLKPQLERVEALLEKAQKAQQGRVKSPKLSGNARKLWPIYLRLLDAERAAARPMEIFKQFESEGLEETQGAANAASKIKGMIQAAHDVQEKVIHYL